ncbi:MAG: cupin domain-containing protein [Microbacterium sp.]|uniref:cupin domain-containing protein n=1 Tax=Microbacterium sp. TaxID=51671 RepID=UPI001DD66D95|nr:cupin domain-containing protein [Microbacterium sp.]MBW8764461.1 cupin domain-containing protein [Microbacterium sp.]
MSALAAGQAADAGALELSHDPLPTASVACGVPTTATLPLATIGATEVGVWEMTPGTAADTEADEVFVVLSGRATIRFVSPELPPLEVGPGSIVRLAEGMQTEWAVSETLRKVYVA